MPTAEAYQAQIPASGHSRQKCDVRDRSAYPPIATAERTWRDVSNVPTRDSCTASNSISIRSPRLREQPTPLSRAGELDEVFSQAAKTGAIGNARKAA